MSDPRVVHCKRARYDVYVGRPSRWGNPFAIGRDGTRDEVITRYEEWVQTQPSLMAALPELRGKVLGCWCAPARCHGEVLLRLLEGAESSAAAENASKPGSSKSGENARSSSKLEG